jgi:predicted SPOUT superfamily RNA methylase MTH1
VVIFSDGDVKPPRNHHRSHSLSNQFDESSDEYTGTSDPDHFLVHLLSYLETPPHLRRLLFPLHPNLRTAGTLPSLDLPHHLRPEEWSPYREGVTLSSEASSPGTSLVEAGLRIPITVDAEIPPSTRVTLKFESGAEEAAKTTKAKEIKAKAVNPDEPREEGGYYWGYNVRRASSLSAVFEECTYEGGYDITIGTSERGTPLESLYSASDEERDDKDGQGPLAGNFKHLLIVFGGVSGLEVAVKNDPDLQKLGVKEAKDVFDRWVNVCPDQGSRTIRTEEAIWIGLMGLRRLVARNSNVS